MFINRLAIYKLSFLLLLIPITLIAENIPVTNKLIKKGNIIHENDVIYIEKKEIDSPNIITEIELLVNNLAIKDIKPNSLIFRNQIK